jgi:uncharacterized membrane protein
MTDDRLERTVGNLLRAGVVLSAAVVLTGGAWYLAARGGATPDYRHFTPAKSGLRSLSGVTVPEVVIQIGLLLLIATPVARVVFSLVAFVLERDRLYVAVTAIVLAVLLYSIGTAWL